MPAILASKLLKSCSTFLFDCDGVIWRSSKLIPGAKELIDYLLEQNKSVYLISNNSKLSVEQYAVKCRGLGLPVVEKNIVCSSNVLADYLHRHNYKGPFYVIGEEGIGLELDKVGISHFGIGPDKGDPTDVHFNDDTTGVIVGYDREFNYRKLTLATTYVCRGLPFIATNEDSQFPAEGLIIPGTGSLVAAVKVATGQEPIVMGKPHKPTFDMLVNSCGIDPSTTIMIGDRLDTDILFGNNFNLHTACVMTGVTKETDFMEAEKLGRNDLLPELRFHSVAEILTCLRS